MNDSRATSHEPRSTFKIADFGLARHLGAGRQTRPGNVVGTPAFMAPEQAGGRDEDVGPRTDVYGLGTILYQVLTGRAPFEGPSDWQVLHAVQHRPPTPPRELQPDTPAELEAVCLRCLAKAPDRRYPTAEALADDLRRYLDGLPVVPPPPTVLMEGAGVHRFGRRVALAGAVLLTALLVPGILFLFRVPDTNSDSGPPPTLPAIRLGVLHPTAGPLADEGDSLAEGVRLAVKELNARAGKVLGRPVEVVWTAAGVRRADLPELARRLIDRERVDALVGGQTAQDRRMIERALANRDYLLLSPAAAEGLDQSPHVIQLGPTPAQLLFPVVDWLHATEGRRRLFLVGADSLWPRAAFLMLRQHLAKEGSPIQVVGEAYLPESRHDLAGIVKRIRQAKAEPDLILDLLYDDDNLAFLEELYKADVRPPGQRVAIFRAGEKVLRNLNSPALAGQYLAGFSLPGPPGEAATDFAKRRPSGAGGHRPADDTMAAAYAGVRLWAEAVRAAKTVEPKAVRAMMCRQAWAGPTGPTRAVHDSGYSLPIIRLEKILGEGRLDLTHEFTRPPLPQPFYGPGAEWWRMLVGDWRHAWGGFFYNPKDTESILRTSPDPGGATPG